MRWFRSGDGRLILDGTGFAISYDGSQNMPFRLRHPSGPKHDTSYFHLAGAKEDAESKAGELIEMGLIELESP